MSIKMYVPVRPAPSLMEKRKRQHKQTIKSQNTETHYDTLQEPLKRKFMLALSD